MIYMPSVTEVPPSWNHSNKYTENISLLLTILLNPVHPFICDRYVNFGFCNTSEITVCGNPN